MKKILIVEDDFQALESMKRTLEHAGFAVETARDGQEALEKVRPSHVTTHWDAIVSDVRMPRMTGLEFLEAVRVFQKEVPILLMTAFGRVEDAVWAMKLGAVDFLTKPFKRKELIDALENAFRRASVLTVSRNASHEEIRDPSFIGASPAILNLQKLLAQIAPTEATVLVLGESGVGKERVARLIHEGSSRRDKKFIALNCAALPENLIEAELFGHEKGAFTGATQARAGLFEAAHGGTLLLDEIGDMPLSVQTKLLRVLEDHDIRRVGSSSTRKADVRVIAATHRDLATRVQEGLFRADLLFRLDVVSLRVPPLRERVEDIPLLARFFLQESNLKHHKTPPVEDFSEEAWGFLMAHHWPGNVRELRNVVERALIFSNTSRIEKSLLPNSIICHAPVDMAAFANISIPIGTSLKDVEDLLIRKTLEATQGNKTMTARLLGINSRTIYRKLEKNDP